MAIQALQPRVKEIQAKYKGRDPQEAQVQHRPQAEGIYLSSRYFCLRSLLQLMCLTYDSDLMVQVEIARLYQEAKVNPLAGCLPTLATLPVWIGLYRALSNVTDEGLLTEGFFWIPSLAGPTSLAAQKAVSLASGINILASLFLSCLLQQNISVLRVYINDNGSGSTEGDRA